MTYELLMNYERPQLKSKGLELVIMSVRTLPPDLEAVGQ